MTDCKARQHSDQITCECGSVWDMNDPHPPKCERRNGMSEKTMPKWGEIVHVNGKRQIVTRVEQCAISLRDERDRAGVVLVSQIDEYKPRTITIGDMEVPEPVREPLEDGTAYWLPDTGSIGIRYCVWDGCPIDHMRLKSGMIQRTEKGAYKHLDALIRVSGGSTE